MSTKKLVYLAVPYTHPDENVRLQRFHIVNKVASDLIKKGLFIFSPISSSHPISIDGGLRGDWEFWENYDKAFLECCNKLIVLKLDGWEDSKGVTGEIKIAIDLGIPIEYMEYTKENMVNQSL